MIMMKVRPKKNLMQFINFKNSKFAIGLIKFIKTSYINIFSCSLLIDYLVTKDFNFEYFRFNYQFIAESTHFYINLR
jgi:hypothetical protein